MAQFNKMTDEQIAEFENRRLKGGSDQRKVVAEQYRNNLGQFKRGDWVEVTLDPGDKRETVKSRLKRAAETLGVDLEFKRTRGDRLRFQLK